MEPAQKHLVFLTPSAVDAEALAGLLAPACLHVHHATGLEEAAALIGGTQARVLVVERSFPDGGWADALGLLARLYPTVVLVVSAADADDRLWAETINCGAYDLVPRPFYAPETYRILTGAYSYATGSASRPVAAAS